jgi:hypothetical protein
VHDANGDPLDGARSYRLHVDPDPPAKNFWAVDVYDAQSRSLIQVPATIWPALASNSGTLRANDDGSHDRADRRPGAGYSPSSASLWTVTAQMISASMTSRITDQTG